MSARSALAFSPGAAGPLLRPDDLSWRDHAACQYTDPDAFFATDEDGDPLAHADKARRICMGCPVRGECLSYALDAGEKWGIWAGLDPREIANERRRKCRRSTGEIIADADARYFARADARIAAGERKLERDRRARAENAELLRLLGEAA